MPSASTGAVRRAVLCLASLSACSAPATAVQLQLPSGFENRAVELTVLVYQLAAGSSLSCDDVAYGDVGPQELALIRAYPLAADGSGLGAVPLAGDKLVVVQGVEDGERVLEGCAPLDADGDGTELEITLEPTVDLVLGARDDLLAQVTRGDSVDAQPPLELSLVHLDGTPAAGEIRILTLDAYGEIIGKRVVPTDASGATPTGDDAPKAEVTRPGPFEVQVRARHQRRDEVVRLVGFGFPADAQVDPFGGEALRRVEVWPVGAATAAFVGFTAATPAELVIAVPDATAPGETPTFTVTRRAAADDAETLGVVQEPAAGHYLLLLLGAGELRFVSDTEPGTAIPVPGNVNLGLGPGAVAIGPCAGRPVGSPPVLLTGNVRLNGDRNAWLLDLAGTFGPETPLADGFVAYDSACVADTDGVVGRVVIGLTQPVSLRGLGRGYYFGTGLADVTTPVTERYQDFAGAVLASLDDRAGAPPALLVHSVVNSRVVVDRHLLLPDIPPLTGEAPLLGAGERVLTLPNVAGSLRVGAFTRPGVAEAAAIILPRFSLVGTGDGVLYVGVLGGGAPVYGAVELAGCGSSPGCQLRAFDIDGDGTQELLIANPDVAAGGTTTLLLRLAP